mgnify:CR=1 FL=1
MMFPSVKKPCKDCNIKSGKPAYGMEFKFCMALGPWYHYNGHPAANLCNYGCSCSRGLLEAAKYSQLIYQIFSFLGFFCSVDPQK